MKTPVTTALPDEVNKSSAKGLQSSNLPELTPAQKIWTSAQGMLRGILNPETYHLWFASIHALDIDNDSITLAVANDFCEVWLKDNYLGLIQDAVTHASGQTLKVRFAINRPSPASSPTQTPTKTPSQVAKARAQKPVDREALCREHGFNPQNTFDNFVVGNNRHTHAAALAVSQSPGKSYNPLFVYGGVGLGKTHLLHAIGQHVASQKKNARIAYLSSERFTNEYIDAIQNSQLVRFRRKYRQTDVLLIDDIQFLAGKERIQEEFFHTFNALHQAHKQIVLTCDRPASEIQNLEHRLVSRFEWGLTTVLEPPDVETRLAILRKKQASGTVQLPDQILDFLASRIRTNVRRLEGALLRVVSYASLTGQKLTQDVVEDLLREILLEEGRLTITCELIQKVVADHFDLRIADMKSKRRPENIAFPRQIAMHLARHMTENSLNAIGEAFGGRDHGTVLHACRTVKNRMETDSDVRNVVHYLERQLHRQPPPSHRST